MKDTPKNIKKRLRKAEAENVLLRNMLLGAGLSAETLDNVLAHATTDKVIDEGFTEKDKYR